MPPADPRPILGVIAVLVTDAHVLLVKRKKMTDAGKWGFPGGHVEWGETGLDAAVRELAEETGVTARAVDYLTNIDVIPTEDGATSAHYLLAAVLCEYVSGTPVAADDVSDAAWVATEDVLAARLWMSDRVGELMLRAQERRAGLRAITAAPKR